MNNFNLPRFKRLCVENYGLYPGKDDSCRVEFEFDESLTLFVGANGLGKSTLLKMIFHTLTGPYDLSKKVRQSSELGTQKLEISELKSPGYKTFAARVNDGAERATVELEFQLGEREFRVVRSLKDLSLLALYDNQSQSLVSDETAFQKAITKYSGFSRFSNWILLLRFVTFYFEERRSLVWDSSAQRVLLHTMLLPAEDSRKLYAAERKYLELESEYRNTKASLGRSEKRLKKVRMAAKDIKDREKAEQLEALTSDQQEDRQSVELALEKIQAARKELQKKRRQLLKREETWERRESDHENAKLEYLLHSFPDADKTVTYLLSRFMSGEHCSVCNQPANDKKEELKAFLSESSCLLCGQSHPDLEEEEASDETILGVDWIGEREKHKERIAHLQESQKRLKDSVNETSKIAIDLAQKCEARQDQIESLRATLDAAAGLSNLQEAVSGQKQALELTHAELNVAEEELANASKRSANYVSKLSEEICTDFNNRMRSFLFEDAELVWEPRLEKFGQAAKITQPYFQVRLSGGDTLDAVEREGHEAVSQSQKEFIDLAFRMSLLNAATDKGGCILIDAPEASLDAVFEIRAAEMLAQFTKGSNANQLIITSNLISGPMLRNLAGRAGGELSEKRLVNLLEYAVPTQAVRENLGDYREKWEELHGAIFGS